jgi:hypothetical protein
MKDKSLQYLDSLGGSGHDVLRVLVSLPTKQLLEFIVSNAWVANYSGFVIILCSIVRLKV